MGGERAVTACRNNVPCGSGVPARHRPGPPSGGSECFVGSAAGYCPGTCAGGEWHTTRLPPTAGLRVHNSNATRRGAAPPEMGLLRCFMHAWLCASNEKYEQYQCCSCERMNA